MEKAQWRQKFYGKDLELAYAGYISGKREHLEVSKDY